MELLNQIYVLNEVLKGYEPQAVPPHVHVETIQW